MNFIHELLVIQIHSFGADLRLSLVVSHLEEGVLSLQLFGFAHMIAFKLNSVAVVEKGSDNDC
jgi:hypothetical protein